MRSLALAVTDFALPGETDAPAPEMPALERLLARGESAAADAPSWRHWALAQAGIDLDGALPIAAVVAGRPGHWALATPVHLLAGLERVHVDPSGLPQLSQPEQEALAGSFNEVFGSDGLRLSFEGRSGLLELPTPWDATSHDPQSLLGREAGRWLPEGPDGPRLRRLMTEIQMWLHAHPLNAAREARGEPPVNALWLWGHGGEALPRVSVLPALASEDPFLLAVWRVAGQRRAGSASSLGGCLAQEGDLLATVDLAQLAAEPARALRLLDAGWFAPLERALAGGRLRAARLYLAGRHIALRPRDRLRFWRRRVDWTQVLQ